MLPLLLLLSFCSAVFREGRLRNADASGSVLVSNNVVGAADGSFRSVGAKTSLGVLPLLTEVRDEFAVKVLLDEDMLLVLLRLSVRFLGVGGTTPSRPPGHDHPRDESVHASRALFRMLNWLSPRRRAELWQWRKSHDSLLGFVDRAHLTHHSRGGVIKQAFFGATAPLTPQRGSQSPFFHP